MMSTGNKSLLSFFPNGKKRAMLEKLDRYERDEELASRLQLKLFLAQGNTSDSLSMHYRYIPLGAFGGDMFGCLTMDDGRVCYYIADVAGNDFCSAMITLYMANTLRSADFSSPSEALIKAREAFLALNDDERLYVTMFFVMFDPATGELTWANAGLNTVPLLLFEGGAQRLYAPGIPLCNWVSEASYKDNSLYMPVGASLLLYTDGLIDTKSTKLTEEEIEARAIRLKGETLLESLQNDVKSDTRDDICLLLIERVM